MRDIPDAYIKAAKKKIQAEPPEPKMKDGKPVEVFMYFFYFQGIPISWSLTFISRSTSNHDIYPLCRSRNVAGQGGRKMAGDNRSLIESGYYRGLQHFEYFIVGVSLALCAYVGHTLHPEKLTFLSAYTTEIVSLALLIFSAGVGLKRIESLVQISCLNGQLHDAIEKRGAVMEAKPNSEGLIFVKYPARILTTEAAANWVGELNEKIQVLHHLIEKKTTRADSLYKWRNRLLLIGVCGLVLSKVLTPYLQSY